MTALHIISEMPRPGLPPIYQALIDGEFYTVHARNLDMIEEGYSPEDLGLTPDADEPAEWWPGSPDEDSTLAFARLRGDR